MGALAIAAAIAAAFVAGFIAGVWAAEPVARGRVPDYVPEDWRVS